MARARNNKNKCRLCSGPCPLFIYGEKSPTSKRPRLYCDGCLDDEYLMKQAAEQIPTISVIVDREYRRPNQSGRRVVRKGTGHT